MRKNYFYNKLLAFFRHIKARVVTNKNHFISVRSGILKNFVFTPCKIVASYCRVRKVPGTVNPLFLDFDFKVNFCVLTLLKKLHKNCLIDEPSFMVLLKKYKNGFEKKELQVR